MEGKQHSVRVDTVRQVGREQLQKLSLAVHIHPRNNDGLAGGMGFSDADYAGFIADHEQIGDIMRVNDTVFMSLKTSATPDNMQEVDIQRRIKKIREETLLDGKKTTIERLVNFNRSVCMEFGMVLYMATPQTRDLMNRVPVAV